jgi:hypothetical protein
MPLAASSNSPYAAALKAWLRIRPYRLIRETGTFKVVMATNNPERPGFPGF